MRSEPYHSYLLCRFWRQLEFKPYPHGGYRHMSMHIFSKVAQSTSYRLPSLIAISTTGVTSHQELPRVEHLLALHRFTPSIISTEDMNHLKMIRSSNLYKPLARRSVKVIDCVFLPWSSIFFHRPPL